MHMLRRRLLPRKDHMQLDPKLHRLAFTVDKRLIAVLLTVVAFSYTPAPLQETRPGNRGS